MWPMNLWLHLKVVNLHNLCETPIITHNHTEKCYAGIKKVPSLNTTYFTSHQIISLNTTIVSLPRLTNKLSILSPQHKLSTWLHLQCSLTWPTISPSCLAWFRLENGLHSKVVFYRTPRYFHIQSNIPLFSPSFSQQKIKGKYSLNFPFSRPATDRGGTLWPLCHPWFPSGL